MGAMAPVILRKRLIAPAVSTRNGKILLTLGTRNIKILNTLLQKHIETQNLGKAQALGALPAVEPLITCHLH